MVDAVVDEIECAHCRQRLSVNAFTTYQLEQRESWCAQCTRAERERSGNDPLKQTPLTGSLQSASTSNPAGPRRLPSHYPSPVRTPPPLPRSNSPRIDAARLPPSPLSAVRSPRPSPSTITTVRPTPAFPYSPRKQRSPPVFHFRRAPSSKKQAAADTEKPPWRTSLCVSRGFEDAAKTSKGVKVADLSAEELRQSSERQYLAGIEREATRQRLTEQQHALEDAAHSPSLCHPRRISTKAAKELGERQLAYAEASIKRRMEIARQKSRANAELAERKIPAFTEADIGKSVTISGKQVYVGGAPARNVRWDTPRCGNEDRDIDDGMITNVTLRSGNDSDGGLGGKVTIEKTNVFPHVHMVISNPSLRLAIDQIKAAAERNHAISETYRMRKEELKRRIYPEEQRSPRLPDYLLKKASERLHAPEDTRRSKLQDELDDGVVEKVLSKSNLDKLFDRLYLHAAELRDKQAQLVAKKRAQEEADIVKAMSRTTSTGKITVGGPTPSPPAHRKPPALSPRAR